MSGVRRFAAELAHDLELLEEGLEDLGQRMSRVYSKSGGGVGGEEHRDDLVSESRAASKECGADAHALHAAAPLSAGPYGMTHIPGDIARKLSAGLQHACSSVLTSGATAVADQMSAVANRLRLASTASCDLTLTLFSSLTSTAATADITSGSTSSDNTLTLLDSLTSTASTAATTGRALLGYPSWPVPGLSQTLPELDTPAQGVDSETAMVGATEVAVADCVASSSEVSATNKMLPHEPKDEVEMQSSLETPPSAPPPAAVRAQDGIAPLGGASPYWRVKTPVVSKVLVKGAQALQLEVSPWMWRHQALLNYHLSSDPASCESHYDCATLSHLLLSLSVWMQAGVFSRWAWWTQRSTTLS